MALSTGDRPTRISACVMAAADPELLERCLKALHFVDEINVLLDARHGDICRAVAEAHAHRIEAHAFEGYRDQRARCLGLASHEWVLAVDADEVVSAELAAEIIRGAGEAPPSVAGFELDRVAWHLGRWIEHGDFHPDWKLRLVRPGRARVGGREPHDRIEVEGGVERLHGRLEHYSYRDLADQIERMNGFADTAALEMHARGRRARGVDLVLRPPLRFLGGYLLKQGFRDGWPGFVVAAVSSYYVFLKYARLWELERVEPRR